MQVKIKLILIKQKSLTIQKNVQMFFKQKMKIMLMKKQKNKAKQNLIKMK